MTGIVHLDIEEFPSLFWKKTGLITSHSRKTVAQYFHSALLVQLTASKASTVIEWHRWPQHLAPLKFCHLVSSSGGDIWKNDDYVPDCHTISLELSGRVETAVARVIHAMLTNLWTELEYRNILWAICGTLRENLKPARHRSQHPDDITYQNMFSLNSCVSYFFSNITKDVWKVMPPYLYLYSQTRYLNETREQIQLRKCTVPIRHFSSLPLVWYNFRLFSKQFSHSSLNFFITCEMNSFEMFLGICVREFRWCQIQAARKCTEQLKIWCSVMPLWWQHSRGVWRYTE
jgi:hypothetical protein